MDLQVMFLFSTIPSKEQTGNCNKEINGKNYQITAHTISNFTSQTFYYQINTNDMYPLTLERAAKMHFMHSKNISDTMKHVEEVQIMTDFQDVSTLLTLQLKGTWYTSDSLQHCNWLCDGSV